MTARTIDGLAKILHFETGISVHKAYNDIADYIGSQRFEGNKEHSINIAREYVVCTLAQDYQKL